MKQSDPQGGKNILAARVLKKHRLQIDRIDRDIMKLLGERFAVIRAVAQIKIKQDIPAVLDDRVVEVRENAVRLARKYGIDPGLAHALYNLIIYRSCETEAEIKLAQARRRKTRKK
jgi:chorismate mutase-like protein